jgi:hypothetical protein
LGRLPFIHPLNAATLAEAFRTRFDFTSSNSADAIAGQAFHRSEH